MLYLTFIFIQNRKKIKGQQMQEDEFAKIINDIKTTRWMDGLDWARTSKTKATTPGRSPCQLEQLWFWKLTSFDDLFFVADIVNTSKNDLDNKDTYCSQVVGW